MSEKGGKSSGRELQPSDALGFLEQKMQVAQDELASRTDVGPDVLNYLAVNGATATRAAVAANPSASAETNYLLSDDLAEEVRTNLARKIGKLFPGMLLAEKEHIRDLAMQTLERLASDEAMRVRAVLSEEIKQLDCVPRKIVKKLAADVAEVSTPVVEYSPQLTDDDLIEIVAAAETNAILEAVARRKGLKDKVSDAVIATSNTAVIATLLKNVDASIRKRTLDKLVSQAAEVAEWHGPLVMRTELSQKAIKRLSIYVGSALIQSLAKRNQLDRGTFKFLEQKLAERQAKEVDRGHAPDETLSDKEIDAAFKLGQLNDTFLTRAIQGHRKETIIRALSQLAEAPENAVRNVLEAHSAKPVIALVWKAGLNMRTAYKIQTEVMRLFGTDLIPARGGTEFPLTESEMRWHLTNSGLAKK